MKNICYMGTTPIVTVQIPADHAVNLISSCEIKLTQGTTVIKKVLKDCSVDTNFNTLDILLRAEELKQFSASVVNVTCTYELYKRDMIFAAQPFPIRIKEL